VYEELGATLATLPFYEHDLLEIRLLQHVEASKIASLLEVHVNQSVLLLVLELLKMHPQQVIPVIEISEPFLTQLNVDWVVNPFGLLAESVESCLVPIRPIEWFPFELESTQLVELHVLTERWMENPFPMCLLKRSPFQFVRLDRQIVSAWFSSHHQMIE